MTKTAERPSVSIILSTHNGGQKLINTLEAFTKLSYPESKVEIIAVDNNSTDDSSASLHQYETLLPLTILTEERQGKNFAMNTALSRAKGDLIVFTDDDVIPEKDWLNNIIEISIEKDNFDIFAGTILPNWPTELPAWISHTLNIGMLYAITPDMEPGPVPAWAVWGPNMAVRKSALDRTHGFDTQVGPDGSTNYIMGSETELLNRLERLGHRAWFAKSAVIHHQIRADQLDRNWALQRYFRFGRSSYKLNNQRASCKHFINDVERWLWTEYVMKSINFLFTGPFSSEKRKIQLQEQLMVIKGQIYQSKLHGRK